MNRNTAEIAAQWDRDGFCSVCGLTFNELHKKLEYLERNLFYQYVPTLGVEHPDYETRMQEWLRLAVSDEDRRVLFEFASEITFFTREDFAKLYEAAMAGPISRWLVDILALPFNSPSLASDIADAAHKGTWYCPMTDSMPIADFHHTNGLGGIDYRPDWRSLVVFSDINVLTDFMNNHQRARIERVVILEDFVGAGWQIGKQLRRFSTPSGEQMLSLVEFARLFPNISFLFVPLIICPAGANVVRALADPLPNVRVEPVLELSSTELISPNAPPQQNTIQERIFDLSIRMYHLVKGTPIDARPYGPFGNGETGARLVMYSNTPAGTLPLIQHRSDTWSPLFPRSARVK